MKRRNRDASTLKPVKLTGGPRTYTAAKRASG